MLPRKDVSFRSKIEFQTSIPTFERSSCLVWYSCFYQFTIRKVRFLRIKLTKRSGTTHADSVRWGSVEAVCLSLCMLRFLSVSFGLCQFLLQSVDFLVHYVESCISGQAWFARQLLVDLCSSARNVCQLSVSFEKILSRRLKITTIFNKMSILCVTSAILTSFRSLANSLSRTSSILPTSATSASCWCSRASALSLCISHCSSNLSTWNDGYFHFCCCFFL